MYNECTCLNPVYEGMFVETLEKSLYYVRTYHKQTLIKQWSPLTMTWLEVQIWHT
jgi:hypothetical protein